MKTLMTFIALTLLLSPSLQARIVLQKDGFFIESKNSKMPIDLLNTYVRNKEISQVKLFASGNVHLVSFAKNNEKEKLYSVDEKGFIYSINPFTNYDVKSVDAEGYVHFKQENRRKYRIDSKGFFLY